jgi:hypothetical protein
LLLAALAAVLVVGLVVAFDSGGDDGDVAGLGPSASITTATSLPRSSSTTAGISPPSTTATSLPPATTAETLPATAPPTTVAAQGDAAGGTPADLCPGLEARAQELDAAGREVNVTYRHDRATRDRLRAAIDAEKQAIDTQMQSLAC